MEWSLKGILTHITYSDEWRNSFNWNQICPALVKLHFLHHGGVLCHHIIVKEFYRLDLDKSATKLEKFRVSGVINCGGVQET